MIKRDYFMSARAHQEGGGFRYEYIHMTSKSLFPNSMRAFEYMVSEIERSCKGAGVELGKIEVICFCRC